MEGSKVLEPAAAAAPQPAGPSQAMELASSEGPTVPNPSSVVSTPVRSLASELAGGAQPVALKTGDDDLGGDSDGSEFWEGAEELEGADRYVENLMNDEKEALAVPAPTFTVDRDPAQARKGSGGFATGRAGGAADAASSLLIAPIVSIVI